MKLSYIFICFLLFSNSFGKLSAQEGNRRYRENSVLAKGSWYKLAISQPGIYKIDLPFLQRLGIPANDLQSNTIHLYGTGGAMLGEGTSAPYIDDLPEIAVSVTDDGDGLFNNNDRLLFYAPGPHRWGADDQGNFRHLPNVYTDTAYYYLNIDAPNGLRVQMAPPAPLPLVTENAFDFHLFYERDSINFLNSGKQWWGQEFSNVVGLSRTYLFTLPANPVGDVQVKARVAGRSRGGCNFNITVNGQSAIKDLYLLPVTDNVFEGVASSSEGEGQVSVNTSQLSVGVSLAPDNINDKGWLDYLEIQGRCGLVMPGSGALEFRSSRSLALPALRYALYKGDANTEVWDISNPLQPMRMPVAVTGDTLAFTGAGKSLREYVAFRPSDVLTPEINGPVAMQDLHGQGAADMLILTHPLFLPQAERLAAFHRGHDQLTVHVSTTEQVYNEFAGGAPDPAAIRNYVKKFADQGKAPRYLLLFGAASYDYRNRVKNNTNLVPTWQSEASLDGLRSYASDDFYAILEDGGDINRLDKADELELGVGRIPATSVSEAVSAVDKIIRYTDPATLGRWRNEMMLVADDEDNNLHFNDAEQLAATMEQVSPLLHLNKIYVDAYPQVAVNGAVTSPEVNDAINKKINDGVLIVNYTGHGSNARLAAESVVDAGSLGKWQNGDRLPLFVTATCDFAPFDDPGIVSLGHKILFMRDGGAIGLMTTTRAVVAASNRLMNENYLKALLTATGGGLGEAAKTAKNNTFKQSNDFINNRKFQLLGDPALRLAYPRYKVVTDSINGAVGIDSLKALSTYVVKGHIASGSGTPVNDFNGTLYTTIYDQPLTSQTRGNDAGSIPAAWQQQKNILFQGSQTITNGYFSFTFVTPKDISSGDGKGTISYYANNSQTDGAGSVNGFITGGQAANVPADIAGPVINAWVDSRRFNNYDIVGPTPTLLVDLADNSGINISGRDPAHRVIAVVDGIDYIVLNDFFEAYLDNFQKGNIRYPLSRLSTGLHSITIQAWDNYNNKSEVTINFTVAADNTLAVEDVKNYPNPVQGYTRFSFIHNQPGEELAVTLQVFTLEGKLVKTLRDTIISANSRFDGMPWDGRNDSGARLSTGLYLYRLTIKSSKGAKVKGGKLVIL